MEKITVGIEEKQVIEKKEQIDHLVQDLRNDINHLNNPKAQALFETAAEILTGLSKAFQHYKDKEEKAWK